MKPIKPLVSFFVIIFSLVVLFPSDSFTASKKDKKIIECDIVIQNGRVIDCRRHFVFFIIRNFANGSPQYFPRSGFG